MKKTFSAILVFVLVVSLLLAACAEPAPAPPTPAPTPAPPAPAPAPPKPEPVVLKATTFMPIGHANVTPWVDMFIDRLKERSNGELIIDWLGGPEVIAGFDQTDALITGVVDILPYHPFGYMAAVMPEGNAGGLTELTCWEERETGAFDLWDEIFQKKINAKYLGRSHTAPWLPFWVYSNKRIEKMEDFKGLIIRVMPLYIPFLESLGASTITLPPPDIYTAMERGTVDAFMYPMGTIDWGLHEVTKYRIEPGVFTMEAACFANLDSWGKIPKHLQDLLLETMADFEYIGCAQHALAVELEREAWIEAGVEIITLSPDEAKRFRDIAYGITWEAMIKDAPEYGPKLRELTTRK